MHKKLLTALIPLLMAGWMPANGQQPDTLAQQDTLSWDMKEVPLQKKLLPYTNPFATPEEEKKTRLEPRQRNLDNFQKDVMIRVADIYRLQVKAIEAQVNEDPLAAEENITAALTSLQGLLEDYPEVQSDRRFSELYRSVMTEYREFYGIEEPANEAEGEIFAIHEELFSGEDDWMNSDYTIPEDITTAKTEVPLVQNEQVNRTLMYYTLRRPEVMERWLERSEKYFPMMREIFREENVPVELIHLAMIESGLNPSARSWASAVGMWQFIGATGRMYGLESNWWMDERRDPEKATRAAARHLRDLYNIWGDWHLAMANYNISPRGLKRAINAAGEENYWAAYPYLPRETRNYVPGFIAATMVSMNPEEFGFQRKYGEQPYDYEVMEVDPLMPLEALAEAAGISTDLLEEYNPELLRWATPPGGKYPLKLPVGAREQLAANYEDIPREERSQNITMHTVSRGENLGYIARKYGTTVRSLFETNENLSSTIYPGQKLVVPLPPGGSGDIAASRPSNQSRSSSSSSSSRTRASAPDNSARLTYTVKSGDTIGHIAEWYDVRAQQIRAWNGTGNTIRVGEDLAIYVPEGKRSYYSQVNEMSYSRKQNIEREQRSGKDVIAAYASSGDAETIRYRVKPNDTLSEIALSFGISVSELKRINNIQGNRIYEGQTLRINQPN